MISDCNLIQTETRIAAFTTWALCSGARYVESKLDRLLCYENWLDHWDWVSCPDIILITIRFLSTVLNLLMLQANVDFA